MKNIYFSNLEHLCIPSNTVPAPAIRYYVTSFISDHVTRRQWRLIRHLAVSWYFTSLGRPDRHKLCEFLCWKRLLVEFFNSNLFKRNDVDSWRVFKGLFIKPLQTFLKSNRNINDSKPLFTGKYVRLTGTKPKKMFEEKMFFLLFIFFRNFLMLPIIIYPILDKYNLKKNLKYWSSLSWAITGVTVLCAPVISDLLIDDSMYLMQNFYLR